MVSTAPQPETMACGWARSPSAATTPSSGTTARTARRSASATAAAANAAISVTAIFPGPLATSRVSEKCASPAAMLPPPSCRTASTSAAARPSRQARSAHGGGSGPGRGPAYRRASARAASPPSAAASAANSTQRATASGHSPGVDGCAAAVVASDSGAGPTAKVNELLTGSPSAEITCQATVYTPSPSGLATGTVTTLRPRLCRGGPSPVFCPPAAVSVTGGPARVTGSLNVSVIALGDTGTAESAAGEVNSSVACADAAGARAVSVRNAAASPPASALRRRAMRCPARAEWLIPGWCGRCPAARAPAAHRGPRPCPRHPREHRVRGRGV